MNISDTHVTNLFREFNRVEIGFKTVDVNNALLTFNGFSDLPGYSLYLSEFIKLAKEEISTNCILLKDKYDIDKYFNVVRYKCYLNDRNNNTLQQLFDANELVDLETLRNYNGTFLGAYNIRYELPPLEFKINNDWSILEQLFNCILTESHLFFSDVSDLAASFGIALMWKDYGKNTDEVEEKDSGLRDNKNPNDELSYSPKLNIKKLSWEGTPSQFAFIISLLESKGYLKLNASSEKNAEILLSIFEISSPKGTTSKESLGRVFQSIKRDEKPINVEDAAKFYKNFPHRSELKK